MKKPKIEETESQKTLKALLKIERSSPVVFRQSYNRERIVWKLPNGDIHREYGPAIEFSTGDKIWIKHGFIHREDGPALEAVTGTGVISWWIINFYRQEKESYNQQIFGSNDELKYWIYGIALIEAQFNQWKKTKKILKKKA